MHEHARVCVCAAAAASVVVVFVLSLLCFFVRNWFQSLITMSLVVVVVVVVRCKILHSLCLPVFSAY